MSTANQRAALAELRAARPTVDRLDATRNPEEIAADLIDAWSHVEGALRALMGGSALAGQPLIRELRQQQLLNLEQAHSMLEMLAVRERVQRADYLPMPDDLSVARDAFAMLERYLSSPADVGAPDSATARWAPPSIAGASTPPPPSALPTPASSSPATVPNETYAAQPARASQPWWFMVLLAVALVVAVVIAWLAFGRGGANTNHLQTGIALYKAGQIDSARRELDLAQQSDPKSAVPHIFLGRIAREAGDTALARAELVRADSLEPNNALANRELASFLLARGEAELARRFYVRAVQADTSDHVAQGFLGCALISLGRIDEGMRWLTRAGSGEWSACAQRVSPGAPAAAGAAATPPAQ